MTDKVKNSRFRFLNSPAALSIIAFLLIACAFAWQMFLQLKILNAGVEPVTLNAITPRLFNGTEANVIDAAKVALEYEAQTMRSTRAQALVASRLYIQTLSLICGLALIVMGSSFVFARIETKTPTKIDSTKDSFRFYMNTTAPGLILAALGAFIVAATVLSTIYSKLKTVDGAIYVGASSQSMVAGNSTPTKVTEETIKKNETAYEKRIRDAQNNE